MMCAVLGFLTFVAFVALVIVLIVKNLPQQGFRPDGLPRGRPGPGRHHVRVQHSADGFWLHAPRASPGSVIHYRYWSGGTMRTGNVAVSHGPRGTFVYTGHAPSQIEVLDVLPPGVAPSGQAVPTDDYESDAEGTFASPSAPPQDAPRVPPPAAAPEPFTGPPPAY
jgi:hypothetical protein